MKRIETMLREMRWKRALVVGYVLLLACSHAWTWAHSRDEDRERQQFVVSGARGHLLKIPPMADGGPVDGALASVWLTEWKPQTAAEAARPPVLMIHGSPGDGDNFDSLGPEVAARGWHAWAIDLPGFGRSSSNAPSYSIVAHARASLAALDDLEVERVHLVAWSMGGGVALHMADLAPQRVASLSLLASIGVQEGEGSGNYYFEHLKYALLYAGLIVLPELVPHFGWIDTSREPHAFVRNFWDSDQRPLRSILERTQVPMLVVQGRDDFLVPLSTARTTHELAAHSRFVVVDGSHFLPIGGARGNAETVEELEAFLSRHDTPGVLEERAGVERGLATDNVKRGVFGRNAAPFTLAELVPWWLQCVLLGGAARWFARSTGFVAGLLVLAVQLDLGVTLIAVVVGAACAAGSVGFRVKKVGVAVAAFVIACVAGGTALYFAPDRIGRSWVLACLALITAVAARLFSVWRIAHRAPATN